MTISRNNLFSHIAFILFCLTYYFGHIFGFSIFHFILCFLFIFAEIIAEILSYYVLLSPKIMWIICWQSIIVIARIQGVYESITPWSDTLNLYVLLNTIVFFYAFDFTLLLQKNKKSVRLIANRPNIHTVYLLTVLLFSFGLIGFFATVYICGYIPAFKGLIDSYRVAFRSKRPMILFNIARIACVFPPIIRTCGKKKEILLTYFLLFLYFICSYLSGWRANLFQGMIMYLTAEVSIGLTKEKILTYLKRVVKYGVIILAVFVFFSYSRDIGKGLSVTKGALEYGLYVIYMYIAPQFINFETAITLYKPNYTFVQTLEGLWSFFLDNKAFNSYRNVRIVMKGGYNVVTYLLPPYLDFGLLGTLVVTFLLSAFSASAFYRFLHKENLIYTLGMLAIYNTVIFTMHSGFLFTASSPFIWIIISFFSAYLSNYKIKIR